MITSWLTDTVTPDLDRALHYTLLWGLDSIELRTLGGPEDRVPQVNEAKLKRRLAEHDLPVSAITPGLFEGDASDRAGWLNELVQFEETLRFCRRIRCARVVVSAFQAVDEASRPQAVAALQKAGELAARHGVVLCVLNEAVMAHATGAALRDLLAQVAHPAVQAAWSPAAALRAGENPLEGLMALVPHVALVRCADGVMEKEGWQPKVLDEGAIGWTEQLALLHRHGFDGPLSLEVDVAPRPKQGIRIATRLIQMLREVEASAAQR